MYHGLQFLRFLCALSVVMLHAAEAVHVRTGASVQFGGIASRLGVETFFVISGFVMVMVTQASPDGLAQRLATARTFLIRRVIRVAPMYWLYSALKVLMVLALPALALRASIDWAHVVSSFLFVPAMSPWGQIQPILPVGWTLNFEFLFYAIFAVAIVVTRHKALLATAALVALYLVGANHAEPSSILHFYGRTLLLDFALGMGIAHLTQKKVALPQVFSWLVLLCAVVACALELRGTSPWFDEFGYGLASALIMWSTISLEAAWLHKLKPLDLLGNASYSIYLSHSFFTPGAVILLVKLSVHSPLLLAFGATVIPCVLGCVAYKLAEEPITQILRGRFDGRTRPASA
jgi:exopolysaccharide production protein ExoZ